MDNTGVALGQLVLALDRTLVSLVEAPRGLDVTVGSLALIDPDDLRLPLGASARSADLFLVVGASGVDVAAWLSTFEPGRPVALMIKSPEPGLIARIASHDVAVIAVDPHARWERIYNLVVRVLDSASTPTGAESMRSGSVGDLFELAGEVSRRTGGLISVEDDRSHVLAYSSAGDEADELRRLSILGREGPPEMLAWLRQWGVMDALRTSDGVVSVDERADLGLRPRRAAPIRSAPTPSGGPGDFLGVVWLQQGARPLSDDADIVLTGAAAVAARVISRRRAVGTEHDEVVRRLLGTRGEQIDGDHLGTQLGIPVDAAVVVVGFGGLNGPRPEAAGIAAAHTTGLVSALTLHASAFSRLSVTATIGSRAYVVIPSGTSDTSGTADADDASVVDDAVEWARTAVGAARRQFSSPVRAVVAGPGSGLNAVPSLRAQTDRVLDAAHRESDLIDAVTTVAASRTGVLLGEIVGLLEANPDLIDSRVVELAERDERTGSEFTATLRAYFDHFGDVRAAADAMHIHPNTLRYRLRRVHELTAMDLDEPATRLVVALSLRSRSLRSSSPRATRS